MRPDNKNVKEDYTSIYPTLKEIAEKLEQQLIENLAHVPHVDRIICRAKGIESFMVKTNKTKEDGGLKYQVPLKEIQDTIGARVVVYYKTDVELIKKTVLDYFQRVEEVNIVPDDATKFGYEGFHMICFIPNFIFSPKENALVSNFFELQVKTLYQHAWSQSNHGLGYKPGTALTRDQQRLIAFISAQSWGADKALAELIMNTPENNV